MIAWLLALVLAAAAGLRAETPPPAVHFAFDGDFRDLGPHGFLAEIHGDGVELRSGRKGRAAFIGGTKDWIDVRLEPVLSMAAGATVEFWFKRDDWTNPYTGGSGWQTLAHIGGMTVNITAPGCPLHKPWTLEGDVRGDEAAGAARRPLASAPGAIKPLRWYHVILVHDPERGKDFLYLDGKLVDARGGSPDLAERGAGSMRLGTWYQDNQAFRGWIDEVKVYDFARHPRPDVEAEAAPAVRYRK